MVEEFSFGNFTSFKELNTLNMTAAKIKSKDSRLDSDNVFTNGGAYFLKSKGIYGANASGKSNVVKALVAFLRIVTDSVKDDKILDKYIFPFSLSTETYDKPCFFQLIFRHEGVKYRYGFEADSSIIHSEWLFATPGRREQAYFIRENTQLQTINKTYFAEGEKFQSLLQNDEKNPIFRSNSLFLTTLSSFALGKLSKALLDTITNITVINGLGSSGMYNSSIEALDDPKQKKLVVDFLKYADTGIKDLNTVHIPSSINESPDTAKNEKENKTKKIVVSIKDVYDADFNKVSDIHFAFDRQESEGTKKIFELSTAILDALKEGTMLVIDEFDARFHPLITKKIVELFNSSANVSGQLVFVTHDTNLLSSELLRKDQIDFVEKDKYGASHLYTLVQFKGIRSTDSFENDYIRGKYGAIPYVGGINNLFKHFENAED